MKFEHRSEPLISRRRFYMRLLRGFLLIGYLIILSLVIGMCGYHFLNGLSWIDSLLEASMILGGMGPVATMQNDTAKIFASFYALYSGLVLIGSMGILLTPVIHRVLHAFHAEEKNS